MASRGNLLGRLVRRAADGIGRRFGTVDPMSAQMAAMLRHFAIDVVLDVGANTGQYGASLRHAGYERRIVSFEPQSQAHALLTAKARHDPLWSVHPRCAVGNTMGQVEINIARNSVSSSLRPMLPAHYDAAPESQFIAAERVDLITLDSVFGQYCAAGGKTWLKIDTQGFEKEVLDGAAASSASIGVVQLELSLIPLYEGQSLWDYFLSRMHREGYELWALIPGFSDLRTGRSLQLDAVFART
ncbi:MAG: FkbM family methyltransferase [Gammaproteobacteria bacterium]|nr:FkbM family methyltransferase [Gammaproteobacteria bacterium]